MSCTLKTLHSPPKPPEQAHVAPHQSPCALLKRNAHLPSCHLGTTHSPFNTKPEGHLLRQSWTPSSSSKAQYLSCLWSSISYKAFRLFPGLPTLHPTVSHWTDHLPPGTPALRGVWSTWTQRNLGSLSWSETRDQVPLGGRFSWVSVSSSAEGMTSLPTNRPLYSFTLTVHGPSRPALGLAPQKKGGTRKTIALNPGQTLTPFRTTHPFRKTEL